MAIFNSNYPADIYEKEVPEPLKECAPAVCLLCAEGQPFVTKNGLSPKTSSYYYKIADPRYPNGGNGQLCENPGDEPAVWVVGSAFAVDRNRFFTAGHVVDDVLVEIDSTDVTKLRLVSGYYRKSSPSSPFSYSTLKVKSVERYAEIDICEIVTDSALPATVTPLQLASTNEQRSVRAGSEVHLLGHPLGQPLKYTKGPVSVVDGALDSFRGWTSSFGGNSGCPVMDVTGKVYGVMTSGSAQSDWSLKDSCYGYAKWPNDADHYAKYVYAEKL